MNKVTLLGHVKTVKAFCHGTCSRCMAILIVRAVLAGSITDFKCTVMVTCSEFNWLRY